MPNSLYDRLVSDLRGAIVDEVITNQTMIKLIEDFSTSDLTFEIGNPINTQKIKLTNSLLDYVLTHIESERNSQSNIV